MEGSENVGHLLVKKWKKKCLCPSALWLSWKWVRWGAGISWCFSSGKNETRKYRNFFKIFDCVSSLFFSPPPPPLWLTLKGSYELDSTIALLQTNSSQWSGAQLCFCVTFYVLENELHVGKYLGCFLSQTQHCLLVTLTRRATPGPCRSFVCLFKSELPCEFPCRVMFWSNPIRVVNWLFLCEKPLPRGSMSYRVFSTWSVWTAPPLVLEKSELWSLCSWCCLHHLPSSFRWLSEGLGVKLGRLLFQAAVAALFPGLLVQPWLWRGLRLGHVAGLQSRASSTLIFLDLVLGTVRRIWGICPF